MEVHEPELTRRAFAHQCRVIAYLDPLGRALRRADDELRRRMSRAPHSARLSITVGEFYFCDPREVPCEQTDALLRLPWRASPVNLPYAPVRALIFLSGAPGLYDPDIVVGECQPPRSWTIAAYGAARASAIRITAPLAYLIVDDWPLDELAAALLARHASAASAESARTAMR